MIEKLINMEYRSTDKKGTYAKTVSSCVQYEMENGNIFENNISLNIFFIIDVSKDDLIDCYCTPAYRIQLKTEEDFKVLESLYNIYREDLKELVRNEKNNLC